MSFRSVSLTTLFEVSPQPILVVDAPKLAAAIPHAGPGRRVADPRDPVAWALQQSRLMKATGFTCEAELSIALQNAFDTARGNGGPRSHWNHVRCFLELECDCGRYLYLEVTPYSYSSPLMKAQEEGGPEKFFVRDSSLFMRIGEASESIAA